MVSGWPCSGEQLEPASTSEGTAHATSLSTSPGHGPRYPPPRSPVRATVVLAPQPPLSCRPTIDSRCPTLSPLSRWQ